MSLRKGIKPEEVMERCREVYDATGGRADLDMCHICRSICFKGGYLHLGRQQPEPQERETPLPLSPLPVVFGSWVDNEFEI